MRIYYGATFDGIRIEGIRRVFVPECLTYTVNGNDVSIWEGGDVEIARLAWSAVQDGSGQTFGDQAAAVAHLDDIFSRSPASSGITVAEVDDFDPGDLALLFQSS